MQTIDYFFDFLSPYSYLSWETHKKYKESWEKLGYSINYIPVTLASVIHFHETKGPAEIKSKRDYLFKDCQRFCNENGIRFYPPKHLPFNSLYALRCALKINAQKDQFQIIDTLFIKGWGEGLDIGDPEVITRLLIDVGLDGHQLIDRVTEKEMRKSLKNNVKDAQEKGLFGLPSFLCNNELFWGNDSIKYLNRFLNDDDLVDQELFKSFSENYGVLNNE